MQISKCTKADYDQIVSHLEEFWGSDWTGHPHHPIFIYEFCKTAFVIKEGAKVAAYLFGFISQSEPTAYIHLVGVRAGYKRQGLARRLYGHFFKYAIDHGCTKCKGITTPSNKDSITFHRSLGFELMGEPDRNGIPVVENYAGPGEDRVVFERWLKTES